MLVDTKEDFFFSMLAQFKVEDKTGRPLGRPGDALLYKKDLSIDSLILFGGMLEEKMEEIHLRENRDPIVPLSVIASVDQANEKIVLNVAKEELRHIDNKFVAQEGYLQYIKLKKLAVVEKYREKIGRVIDIFFQADGRYKFIVGGNGLEELLERVHVIPDKNLIIPSSNVVEISDKIILNVDKYSLLSNLESTMSPAELLQAEQAAFVQVHYSDSLLSTNTGGINLD